MSGKVWCILMVVAAMATSGEAMREARQAKQCGSGEECIFLSRCRPLQDLVASRPPGFETTIRNAICGSSVGRDLRVCCPETGSHTHTLPGNQSEGNGEDLLPKGNTCGRGLSLSLRVVFGSTPPLNSYPWVALLGFQDKANPSWKCGGVLINDRYVLTAAHCVHRNFTEGARRGPVVTVRLGGHNTATDPDCIETSFNEKCGPSPQDFSPQEVIIHKDFNKRTSVSDDIALIRLDRKVTLGISVQPVCLPAAGLDVEAFLGSRDAVVAGWGATEKSSSSELLQSAHIPFVKKSVCESSYKIQLTKEQVCFGGRGRTGTCHGDSGGPLFQTDINDPKFFLLGILSGGLAPCGTPGVTAVYTNVAFYRKWITDNIKP